MDIVKKYFKDLSGEQYSQLSKLGDLYKYWNSRINVISRKDIENIYIHHVLHSLSIAKIVSFTDNTSILDVGTGGGFPGIPLAIFFPGTNFTLIDSIAKKIKVVNEVIKGIGLKNAVGKQVNMMNVKGKYDFILSRAFSTLPDFIDLTANLVSLHNKNSLQNGIIYLKGGDIEKEINAVRLKYKKAGIKVHNINEIFPEPYFETKKIISISM